MGVKNNECIIVTTFCKESMDILQAWIKQCLSHEQQSLISFLNSLVNGEKTMFMGPSGSKKGGLEDTKTKEIRDKLIQFILSFDYESDEGEYGGNPFKFIEVGYGEYGQKVLRGNCKNAYSDDEYYEKEK